MKARLRILVASVTVLAATLFLGGMFGRLPGPLGSRDLPVARSNSVAAQLAGTIRDPSVKPPDPEAIEQLQRDLGGMSAEQRRAFAQSATKVLAQRMEADLREFFALAPAEQQKRLDAQVDRIVRARQIAASRRSTRAAGASPPRAARTIPLGTPAFQEKAAQAKKAVLDGTTPELRAMQAEYRRRLNERMRQRQSGA